MTDADPLLRYRFTVRQRQILKRIGAGLKTDAIATELAISPRTVDAHVAMVAAKIGYSHLPARSAILQFLHEHPTRATT